MSINKKISVYLRENQQDIFMDSKATPYYVFCEDKGKKIQKYQLRGNNIVFMHHEEDWDKNGWKDENGMTFRQKLYIAGLESRGVWVKTTAAILHTLSCKCTPCHPSELKLNLSKGHTSVYIEKQETKRTIVI